VLYALNPSEATLRKVLETRAATGHPGSAEAAFTDFSRHVQPTVKLGQDTLDLMDRIRKLAGTRTYASLGRLEDPPLVGRQPHLEGALRVLDRLTEGAFEFLLIKGDAGVGKTRLFEEVMREAHLKGFRCLEARPVELERHIPLNPLLDMVNGPDIARHIIALDEPWRAVVASLLPKPPKGMDALVVPHIAETSLARRLYDAFTFLLTNISVDQPTVLFIDDLQWSDATTVAILQFAQRRWQGGTLGIVATVRPDLVRNGDAVANYLNESRDLPVTTIEVGELGEGDALSLVDLVAQGALDDTVCSKLCALGGLNPFYLIELTRDYLAGKVKLPDLPTDALVIPMSLRQLVDPRLESLSEGAATAAAHLAVWGRWAPMAGIADLLGVDLDTCAREVEELERARLVLVERGSVRIPHQLFRGAIYHGMSRARQAFLHRAVAEYLATTSHPVPGELAIHFAQAGDGAQAARYGRQAADKTLENGTVAEAAHYLQLVIENERDEGLKAEATGDLAHVLHKNREIVRANPLLELAATRLRAAGNPPRALKMDVNRVEGLAEIGATPMSELLDRLDTIKTTARSAGDEEALTLALDAELHLLHRSGRVMEIRPLFQEIRACVGSSNPTARCQANASLALNVLFGDGEEALPFAREAVRIAEEEGLGESALQAKSRLFLVMLYRGLSRTDEARTLLETAAADAKRSGDVFLRFALESNRGVAHMDAGELEEAALSFDRAGAIMGSAEATVARANHHCNLGELAYNNRDPVDALRHFQAAEQALGETTRPTDLAQMVNAGIGLCHLELGSVSAALQRESQLGPFPEMWHFDPTLVLAFAVRLRERRGQLDEACDFITTHRRSIEDRLPPAWMNTLPIEVRLGKKLGNNTWRDTVKAGMAAAERLGYSIRLAQFRGLL